MMRYKSVASGVDRNQAPAKKQKVEGPIDPRLQQRIHDLGSVDSESQNLIKTMAVGLTGWINEATEGENRIEAANRILNCYAAQLEGKTDETATELDLERLGLTTLPPEIGLLTRLQRLFLNNNQLTTLPTEIGGVTSLRVLYLHNNQLTTLPPEIRGLTSLKCLILYNNQLTTLPAEIGLLTSLIVLGVGANKLTTLPAEIGLLTSLIVLGVGANKLTTLPAEIGLLTSLTELWLSDNQLCSLPADLTNLEQLEWWGEEEDEGFNCRDNYLTEAASTNFPEHLIDEETGLGDQKGAKELQKDLEKNREQIVSRREKILGCEKVISDKYKEISTLEGGSATGDFQKMPVDAICYMMMSFFDSDDMKRMRVTTKEMKKIGPIMEEGIIQKAMIKDHKRVIANLEQSRVHLQDIATERGWARPERETEKAI